MGAERDAGRGSKREQWLGSGCQPGAKGGGPSHALPTPSVSRFILHLSLSHHRQPHLGNSPISPTLSLSLCLSLPLFLFLCVSVSLFSHPCPFYFPNAFPIPLFPAPSLAQGGFMSTCAVASAPLPALAAGGLHLPRFPLLIQIPKCLPSVPSETQISEGLPNAEEPSGTPKPRGAPFPLVTPITTVCIHRHPGPRSALHKIPQ